MSRKSISDMQSTSSLVLPEMRANTLFPLSPHAQANGQSPSSLFPDVRTSFSEGAIVGTRRLLEIEPGRTGRVAAAGYAIVGGNKEGTFHLHQTRSDSDAGVVNFVHLETIRYVISSFHRASSNQIMPAVR